MKRKLVIGLLSILFLTGCGSDELTLDDLTYYRDESSVMTYAEYMGIDDDNTLTNEVDDFDADFNIDNSDDITDVDLDDFEDQSLKCVDDSCAEDNISKDDDLSFDFEEDSEDDLSYVISLDEAMARKQAVVQDGFYSDDGTLRFDTVIVTADNGERVIFGSYDDIFTSCSDVDVHINSYADKGSVNRLKAELKNIDSRLVKYFVNNHGQFYIYDDATFDTLKDEELVEAFTRGYYTDDDKYSFASIHCYDGDDDYFDYVLTHELGHGLAFNAYDSTGERIVRSNLWKEIYEDEFLDSGLDEYYMSNSDEYFAGCVEMYYNDYDLKKRCPKSYAYIDAIISELPR